ncbi:type II secretion system protein [Vallitalea okinawensis]|uniref:type II secretion system protein n=1 Tax=Vallitalea okinawensis TaxID=2078660 RepID=UPI000CFB0CA4|nr:type II secretion system protein [Vallitalea okinawensis]
MNEKGFTMVEVVVVIAILLILASIAMPQYIDMKSVEENQYKQAYEKELNIALRQFYLDNGEKLYYMDDSDVKHTVGEFSGFKELTDDTNLQEYQFFQVLHNQTNIYFNDDYKFKYTLEGLFGKIEVEAK